MKMNLFYHMGHLKYNASQTQLPILHTLSTDAFLPHCSSKYLPFMVNVVRYIKKFQI